MEKQLHNKHRKKSPSMGGTDLLTGASRKLQKMPSGSQVCAFMETNTNELILDIMT
jgi:hypothetical protein